MRAPWVDCFLNNEIYCYPLSEKQCGPPVAIPSDRLAGGDRNFSLAATSWTPTPDWYMYIAWTWSSVFLQMSETFLCHAFCVHRAEYITRHFFSSVTQGMIFQVIYDFEFYFDQLTLYRTGDISKFQEFRRSSIAVYLHVSAYLMQTTKYNLVMTTPRLKTL